MDNQDNAYDVKVTDAAWEQMMSHARFLANVSVDAANRLVDEFLESAESLEVLPQRCPWLIHDMIAYQKYRKLLFGNYYMALFQIVGDTVYISTVVDCRQDFGWLL